MQMKQAMDDVQLQLALERVSKPAGMALGGSEADENLAVRKGDDIGRTRFIKELPV